MDFNKKDDYDYDEGVSEEITSDERTSEEKTSEEKTPDEKTSDDQDQSYYTTEKMATGQSDTGNAEYSQKTKSPSGKKIGIGFGVASTLLGVLALVFFCTIIIIVPATMAIIFGIIQIVSYERKGYGIIGLTTGALAIVACIIFWTVLLNSTNFMNMISNYMQDNNSLYQYLLNEDGSSEDDLEEYLENYDPSTDDLEDYLNQYYDMQEAPDQGSDSEDSTDDRESDSEDSTEDQDSSTEDSTQGQDDGTISL